MTSLHKQNFTPEGAPIVAPSLVYVDRSGLVKGHRFICNPDSLNAFDWVTPDVIYLQGVQAEVVDNEDGDYGEFLVVDKDDVLGLFGTYGIPPGGELVLRKFGETVYAPAGASRMVFEFASAFTIPAGLYLRMTWLSTHATVGPRLYASYKLYGG